MPLAIFDLDNTLIGGDSDNLWGQFACDSGIIEATGSSVEEFARLNEQFYQDYKNACLDIDAYLHFAIGPLKGLPMETLDTWHRQFMKDYIEPIMLPKAEALIDKHRQQGDELLIITATNHFITRPIATALGIDNLLACDAEMVDGLYTGKPTGVPTYREGKVIRLVEWLEEQQRPVDETIANAYFYSDSDHDIALLEKVGKPFAVDPNDRLRAHAEKEDWPVISLR